jgi:hypothetical protein
MNLGRCPHKEGITRKHAIWIAPHLALRALRPEGGRGKGEAHEILKKAVTLNLFQGPLTNLN